MFTGLVKEIGQVSSINRNTEGVLISVESKKLIKDIAIDDSVSINGACQTVVSFTESSFTVQAVGTTLEKTNFKSLKVGSPVNLELALRLSDRLGGHLVQGHVNGVGKILGWQNSGKNYVLRFEVDPSLLKYIVSEGSITLNGVSLTISTLNKESLWAEVSIIPHTWENTVFNYVKVGDQLNVEVDVLAKYVENLLLHGNQKEEKKSNISEAWLKSHGF